MKRQKKEEKRKPKYGLFSCVGYIYKKMWRWEKRLAFSCAASIPFRLISAALTLYLPSAILNVLQVSDTFLMVAEVIAALIVTQTLFDALVGYINLKNGNSEHILLLRMLYEYKERTYDKDWYLSLEPEIQKIGSRAQSAIQNNHAAGVHFPVYFSNLIYNILSFILFGAVTVAVHPMLIGIITAGVVVNYFMMRWKRKRDYATRDTRNSINKKLDYLTYRISRDYKYAKDIRLYNLADNVSCSLDYDADKVMHSLEKAGLFEKVAGLEKGIKTPIGRNYENDGVDFSGGELQKLAIARALYKDAPFIVLDEPTAALDPIAEAEVYENFDKMVDGKTTIYISHRLSSCRFCNNIVVFDSGEIVQHGSHDALVSEQEGLYYKLWTAQAQYYSNTDKA